MMQIGTSAKAKAKLYLMAIERQEERDWNKTTERADVNCNPGTVGCYRATANVCTFLSE